MRTEAHREGAGLILTHEGVIIRLVTTALNGSQVKVGIVTPWNVEVVRDELLEN